MNETAGVTAVNNEYVLDVRYKLGNTSTVRKYQMSKVEPFLKDHDTKLTKY